MTCQKCVQNIERSVGGRPGVRRVTVDLASAGGRFEVTGQVTDQQLIDWVQELNARFSARLATELECRMTIENMSCQRCVANIEGKVAAESGVIRVKVSHERELSRKVL